MSRNTREPAGSAGSIRYIAVEGPIGVGKTVLAELLAGRLEARFVKEAVDENPFLPRFYTDMQKFAFQTQVFFLLSRHRQLRELIQMGLFEQRVVSDYLFDKDRIFASLNLTEHEFALYERIYEVVRTEVPKPDVVVYLQARTEVLLARIRRRGRSFEQNIDEHYLESLSELYNSFFLRYEDAPLLIVNTDRLNYVTSRSEFERLLEAIQETRHGRRFYAAGCGK
ncbi:MAG: deoxynucleoside kinase [candidate division WOR-3 bacterium]